MWSPDDLDIRIIKTMASPHSFQWDVRISNAHVAKELDVDEETVRNRLRHMEEAGFLQGWQLILNPILLGMESGIAEVRFNGQGSKDEVISELSLLEGVTLIDDFYGSELAVHLLYENEEMLNRQIHLIGYLTGHPNPAWWIEAFPTCKLDPTKTDWLIIQALRKRAREKLSDVAHDLQISTRTVKRHMLRLIDGNAFYLDPLMDVSKIGGVRSRFWVVCEESKKRAVDEKALSTLKRIISTHTSPRKYSVFIVHCANASEVQEISHWLEKLDGVKEVRSNFDVEHIHIDKWLSREIEKRIAS